MQGFQTADHGPPPPHEAASASASMRPINTLSSSTPSMRWARPRHSAAVRSRARYFTGSRPTRQPASASERASTAGRAAPSPGQGAGTRCHWLGNNSWNTVKQTGQGRPGAGGHSTCKIAVKTCLAGRGSLHMQVPPLLLSLVVAPLCTLCGAYMYTWAGGRATVGGGTAYLLGIARGGLPQPNLAPDPGSPELSPQRQYPEASGGQVARCPRWWSSAERWAPAGGLLQLCNHSMPEGSTARQPGPVSTLPKVSSAGFAGRRPNWHE